jgi:coenzyme F420-reducing hydrogenase beta subunit
MIEVTDKRNCNGCKACNNVCPLDCIIMQEDHEGFWYPQVDTSKCDGCNLCVKVCPQMNPYSNPRSNIESKAFLAYNKSAHIRKKSSCGGAYTTLAHSAIKKRYLVVGAGYTQHMEVIHNAIHLAEEVQELRGVKFAQSDSKRNYIQIKKAITNGSGVMYFGTACQIAGLYKYLDYDYENLITCEILCQGVGSPRIFKEFCEFIENKYNINIKSFYIGNKHKGWQNYSLVIQHNDKLFSKTTKVSKNEAYMVNPLKRIIIRPSCYDCAFRGFPRIADITLAAFNNLQERDIAGISNVDGVTLLLANTKRGQDCIANLPDKDITVVDYDIDKAVAGNPIFTESVSEPTNRQAFFDDFNTQGYEYVARKYFANSKKMK